MTTTLVEMLERVPLTPDFHRRPEEVRLAARAWRAKVRAADIAPLSDKIVYPRKLVDAPPPPPKKGRGK